MAILDRVAPGHGHVVHNPVVLVVHEHALLEEGQLLLVLRLGCLVFLGAKNLALVYVRAKGNLVRRGSDPLAENHLDWKNKILFKVSHIKRIIAPPGPSSHEVPGSPSPHKSRSGDTRMGSRTLRC